MSTNFYDVLGISKSASADEIKKAYRKMAMKYHPDRNKSDTTAEKKIKEVNQAYSVLSDPQKKQQYDTFGSTNGNPFGGSTSGGGGAGFGGFEDIFSQFGGASRGQNSSAHFNFEDLFGGAGGGSPFGSAHSSHTQYNTQKQPESLDFEKTYEVPIFDLILGCKIEVRGVYGQTAKLKIPEGTKPGAKLRVKDFGKSQGSEKGNLIVKIQALMPKNISDVDRSMLERIRENIGY